MIQNLNNQKIHQLIPKFRAWDKECKEMATVTKIQFTDSGFEDPYVVLDTRCDLLSFDKINLMQCTGLRDKNDVDVYQGDYVKTSACDTCYHEIILTEKYGMPMWYLSGIDKEYFWTGMEEIIGNRYENPELLEDSI